MNTCKSCGLETSNPKYCSRSCSAKDTNKIPKRKITRICTRCQEFVRNYRSNLCEKHFLEMKLIDKERLLNSTLGEYTSKDSLSKLASSSRFVYVRNLNRIWNKQLTKKPCENCGYKHHVELAHIKPIYSFPKTARLREVNALENVIQLCRNCHWEFDHNLLTIEEINKKREANH